MNRRRLAPWIVLFMGLSFLAACLIHARETNAQGADAQENTGGNASRQSSKTNNPDALPEDAVPFVAITVLALAIIPVILGIKAAKRKGISPHWMWLGIYPVVGGWIGYWIIYRKPAQRSNTTPQRSHEPANARVPLPSRAAGSGSDMDAESLLDRARTIEALSVLGAKEKQQMVPTAKGKTKNRGDRQDDLSQAMIYWMNRMSSIQKDPFVLYLFNTEKDAREALLELPCIREEEGQKLICTERLVFGYYQQTNGEYEAIIAGEALTHQLWEQAKTSFEKHGGRRKNDLGPEDRTPPAGPAENVLPGAVEFVREERKPSKLGSATAVYRIHKGPNAASARAFLEDNPVTKELYYLVVETPEGNFGCDIQGVYEEPGSPDVLAISGQSSRATIPRIVVGECENCHRPLRMKGGAGKGRIRLTCRCGHINTLGADSSARPGTPLHAVVITTSFPSQAAAEQVLAANTDSEARLDAVTALGKTNSRQVVPALAKALVSDQDKYIRHACAGYLGSIKGAEAEKSLLQAIADPDPYVRKKIVEALSRLGTEQARKAIDGALKDADSEVRAEAEKHKSRTTKKIQMRLCPFLTESGMCEPPRVCDLHECSWETQGRGHYGGCFVYGMHTHPGGPGDFLRRTRS